MSPNSDRGAERQSIKTLPKLSHGVSARDILRIARHEIDQTLKNAKGNRRKALRLSLARAHSAGFLSDADVSRLTSACDTVLALQSKKIDVTAAVTTLEALYSDALIDPASTQAGLTTIDIAYAVARDNPPPGSITVIGSITGGLIGASLGIGWEVGAVIGAGVGFAVDVCLGSEDDE